MYQHTTCKYLTRTSRYIIRAFTDWSGTSLTENGFEHLQSVITQYVLVF